MEANAAEDATRGMLPPLEKGARVWDSKTQSEVTVVKVYYDDDPPYYAVRVESGAERDTVRAKLWTADERAAEAAAKLQREAEIEADACAAALLRDESAAKKSSKSRQRRPAKK